MHGVRLLCLCGISPHEIFLLQKRRTACHIKNRPGDRLFERLAGRPWSAKLFAASPNTHCMEDGTANHVFKAWKMISNKYFTREAEPRIIKPKETTGQRRHAVEAYPACPGHMVFARLKPV